MKERLALWLEDARKLLKRHALTIFLFIVWEIPRKLGEDRIIGGTNRFLDAHMSAIAGVAKPVFAWLISTPFLLPIAVVTGILIHAYLDTQKKTDPVGDSVPKLWPPQMPLARTDVSKEWLYTPLKEIYRRNYHDEDIVLDGHFLIDCTFGKNVVFVFDGKAPFKMMNSQPEAGFVMALKSDNLVIQHLLKFLQDTKSLGGQFIHHPPPGQ